MNDTQNIFPYTWCNCESIMQFFDGIFSTDFQLNCAWLPLNHLLFQIANISVLLTYIPNPTTPFGLLKLRFFLMMAGFSFAFWGAFILCSLDTLIWNLGFAIGNGVHLVYLTIRIKFNKVEDETIYTSIFKPVGVRRYQYKELLKLAERRVYQEIEQTENSFRVCLEDIVLSYVGPLEFMDSSESIDTDEHHPTTYQVLLTARQHSVVYVWNRENIIEILKKDETIKNVFKLAIGKNTYKSYIFGQKNLQVNESKRTSTISCQYPLMTYSAANLLEVCHTFNKDQEDLKNGIPMVSITSPQCSVDLNKDQNLQSVEIPIQNRHSAPNNDLFSQTEFFNDTDGISEETEKQNLVL